jgi:prophage regulatory protein
MKRYRLLSCEMIPLLDFDARARTLLKHLLRLVKAEVSVFEIARVAIGPGSPALQGRSRVTPEIVASPLYRIAADIATRAGIAQGLLLAVQHERVGASAEVTATHLPRSSTEGEPIARPLALWQPSDAWGSYLRTDEVLRLLGVSRVTLWSWRRRGLFPRARRLGPNTIGWPAEEIQAWKASRPPA